jgi:hypothetical protein
VSLARPGGNITGFTNIEAAMAGKWLSLLKEIAPGIKRAAFVFNPDNAPGGGKQFLASFDAAADGPTTDQVDAWAQRLTLFRFPTSRQAPRPQHFA